jgi:hypothetical protein
MVEMHLRSQWRKVVKEGGKAAQGGVGRHHLELF